MEVEYKKLLKLNADIIYLNISLTKKSYPIKKLDPDYKIFVSKFDIDILTSLAATTGFAKCYFCSFSPISLEPRGIFST